MREEDAAEEASLSKRETEDQDDEVEENEEVQERESEKKDYEEEIEEREPKDEAYEFDDKEKMEKRDDEDDDDYEDEDDLNDSEEVTAGEKRENSEDWSEKFEVEDLDDRAFRSSAFKLVDRHGHTMSGRSKEFGLVLYNGGTVCGDHFEWKAAHSICKQLGYAKAQKYKKGLNFGNVQLSKAITLDDVICDHTEWKFCSFLTYHAYSQTNCSHNKDVFLRCKPRKDRKRRKGEKRM